MAFDAMATQSALAQARAAGNINIADSNMEVLDLSRQSLEAQERQAEAQLQLEIARRARSVHVPTKPEEVKLKLREIGEPICLFGERAGDRRERLRHELARRLVEAEEDEEMGRALASGATTGRGAGSSSGGGGGKTKEAVRTETSYYAPETADALKALRVRLARHSFAAARQRLQKERQLAGDEEARRAADATASGIIANVKALVPVASQVGDERRPLSTCAVAPDGVTVATGAWSGLIKVWRRDCSLAAKLRGHTERVSDVVWTSAPSLNRSNVHMASAGADGVAFLWNQSQTKPVAALKGHVGRVCKVRVHPSGAAAVTTSFDKTMRLWDTETQACVQLQEGHTKEVYALGLHPDGSLAATGDLGGIGRVWDLRSGKTAMLLPGHIKQLLSIDFSPNGFVLATASDDHTVRVWDLRKRDCVYSIPAHGGLVSAVKFAPRSGEFLVTSSFDGSVKAWSARDFTQLAQFTAHEGKVSCVDVSPDDRRLVSCSFDRTFKVWTCLRDDEADIAEEQARTDVDMS